MVKVPVALTAMVPEASIRSQSVPAVPVAADISTRRLPPACKVTAPTSSLARAPTLLPGSTAPPMVKLPSGPSPISVAPDATVTAEFASDPLTSRVPALTVVLPLYVFAPNSVRTPAPFFSRVPVPLITPP